MNKVDGIHTLKRKEKEVSWNESDKINSTSLNRVDVGDNLLPHHPFPKKGNLHSRSIALVDLRLTKPPEALRPKGGDSNKSNRPSSGGAMSPFKQESNHSKTLFSRTAPAASSNLSLEDEYTLYAGNQDLYPLTPKTKSSLRVSTPERRKREKLEELGYGSEDADTTVGRRNLVKLDDSLTPKNKDLFADLDAAGRRRLHAMLINFMTDTGEDRNVDTLADDFEDKYSDEETEDTVTLGLSTSTYNSTSTTNIAKRKSSQATSTGFGTTHTRFSGVMVPGDLELGGEFRKSLSLHQFSLDSGQLVTNAVVQELCALQPDITALDLTDCSSVTDAGLWAIARHCPGIRKLKLSGCAEITNIGLRSISLRCSEMVTLDLSTCRNLDDMGLATIAGGCWKLRNLLLVRCAGISDTGLGRLARACWALRRLDVSGCGGVGEYGDHALKELGAFCGDLRELDMTGCRRVQDVGIRAVSVGCPNIAKMRFSGCDGVTNVGLRALAKHSRRLRDLSLRDATSLADEHLASLHSDSLALTLTALDLSGARQITDKGIAQLLANLGGRLKVLKLADSAATDGATRDIVRVCTRLQSLDLCRCRHITDATVSLVAENVTGLTTLRLDGNPQVTARRLTHYLAGEKPLKFAQLARDWLGYQPRLHWKEMIQDTEHERARGVAAVAIQCAIRCRFARDRYLDRRRDYLLNAVIPRAQARCRGVIQRRRFAEILFEIRKGLLATKIQACYRRYKCVTAYDAMTKARRKLALHNSCALVIQCAYRRMLARQAAQDIRNDIANARLREAQEMTRKQVRAILIQCAVRVMLARLEVSHRIKARNDSQQLRELRDRMARVIQRVSRGHLGRCRARRRRWEIAEFWRRWRLAVEIQRCLRGMLGRLRAKRARAEWLRLRQQLAALVIQRNWRGCLGRVLFAMLQGLHRLRIKRIAGASLIQRVWRGYRDRVRVRKLREDGLRERRRVAAALRIQRIYRGHLGREAAEIERALLEMEGQAKPLFSLLATLETEAARLQKLVTGLEAEEKRLAEDVEAIGRESVHADNSTNMYTDSTRVNGIPQRFLTKFLRIRLKDVLRASEVMLEKKTKEFERASVALKDVERRVRGVQRELVPLTTGLVLSVRRNRTKRLRDSVRRQRRACTKIQARWRAATTRAAYRDPARDYWVECLEAVEGEVDEDGNALSGQQGRKYYYNTMTHETRWIAPAAYRLFCRRRALLASQSDLTDARAQDWTEVVHEGRLYLYNLHTQEYRLV